MEWFLANATGREDILIYPHTCYQKLEDTQETRAYAYRKLFGEEPEGVTEVQSMLRLAAPQD